MSLDLNDLTKTDGRDQPAGWAGKPRIQTAGKFFRRGNQRFHFKGVTYGPFNPVEYGSDYHTRHLVDADFTAMAAMGINSIRLYTIPPVWLLDLAATHGLGVIAGVPWTQHVAFLDNPKLIRESIDLTESIMTIAGAHPAMSAVMIGNEIPAAVARWYGPRRIERHLEKLCKIVKAFDPQMPVTYASYPSTEYLELPFLDFVSFNVYLNDPKQFESYLPRLQTVAGDRPLVLTEVGVNRDEFGEAEQAAMLSQKIDAIFSAGAAGAFVFSFTDEWHRHGYDIHDWKFGLVDRDRNPRLAADAVSAAYSAVPRKWESDWPKVSVIICSFNGGATIDETIRHCLDLDYGQLELIVVDDGSTDRTGEIAGRYPVQLIRQEQGGLSVARNTGLHAATGEIVAYIDDDAFPDQDWLTFLVRRMRVGDVVGAGGPNLPVPDDGPIAWSVAHSPGGPTHVLLTDTIAEHLPGCNMAFLRDKLLAIGGFDPQFKIAGDDVDICWRLQAVGGLLGFSAAAQVWHHRRNRVGAYWRQQLNYGRAEARLERKWPEKYNAAGQLIWAGRLYGNIAARHFRSPRRIRYGVWGEGHFQTADNALPGIITSLPTMPEWYLLLGILSAITLFGFAWAPLFLTGLLPVAAVLFAQIQTWRTVTDSPNLRQRLLVVVLHRLQPMARLVGRFGSGLTPWRSAGVSGFSWPRLLTIKVLKSNRRSAIERLANAQGTLRAAGVAVWCGGDFGRWDLQIRGGIVSAIRIQLLAEDFGPEKQLLRWRIRPILFIRGMTVLLPLLALVAVMEFTGHRDMSIIFWIVAVAWIIIVVRQTGAAVATCRRLLDEA